MLAHQGGGCLNGLRLTVSCRDKQDIPKLQTTIQNLGGSYVSPELAPHSKGLDLLIVLNVNTPKFIEITNAFPDIVLVTKDWLDACSSSGQKEPVTDYKAGIFQGLHMALSGGTPRDKASLAEQITQQGGVYSKELSHACTHLLIKQTGSARRIISPKEEAARTWSCVTLVWDTWVKNNLEAGRYKGNEAVFEVSQDQSRALQNPALSSAPAQTRSRREAEAEPSETGSEGQQEQLPPQRTATLPTIGTRVPAAAQQEVRPPMAPANRPLDEQTTKKGLQPLEKCQSRSEADRTGSIAQSDLEKSPSCGTGAYEDDDEDEDSLFLSRPLVHLTCCTPSEQLEMMRILREGGCTRRADLWEDVTHIVVGSDLTAVEVQAITEHMSKYGHRCTVATPDWLRLCSNFRKAVDARAGYALSIATLAQSLAAQGPQQEEARSNSQGTLEDEAGQRSRQGGPSAARVLDGCYFTLTALARFPEDMTTARKMIRKAGGRFFDKYNATLAGNKDRNYAICPISLPRHEQERLEKEYLHLQIVPDRNRVTMTWLDISLDQQRILKPIPQDRVECQPFKFTVPLPGMERVGVYVSALREADKDHVKVLVKLLGGSYYAKYTKKCTHLIVPYAAGDKYLGAPEIGAKPVTRQWIMDAARSGNLPPEVGYHPPPLPPGEVAESSQFSFDATASKASGKKHDEGGKAPTLLRRIMNAPPGPTSFAGQFDGVNADSQKAAWPGLNQGSSGSSRSQPAPKAVKLRSSGQPGSQPAAKVPKPSSQLEQLFSMLSPDKPRPASLRRGQGSQQAGEAGAKEAGRGQTFDPSEVNRLLSQSNSAKLRSAGSASQGIARQIEAAYDAGHAEDLLDAAADDEADAMPEGGSEDDLTSHLERLNGQLQQLPDQPAMSSQQDFLMPPPPILPGALRRAGADDGAADGTRGPSRFSGSRGGEDAEVGGSGRGATKRTRGMGSGPGARTTRQKVQPRKGAFSDGSQMECSQQVGYGGLADSEEDARAAGGSTRASARGRKTAEALQGMAEEQKAALAQAVTRQRGAAKNDELREMGLMD